MATLARPRWALAVLACLMLLTACNSSSGGPGGDDGKGFFKGKTVTFVVPFSPGGGYDTYARLIAPYLEKELGATIVVENREGAGGLLAINNLTTAKPDGLTIAIMNGPGAGGASLAGSNSARFKLDGLSYVGLFSGEGNIFACGKKSSFHSFQDVENAGNVRIGSTGPGAADFVNANVISSVFKLKSDIVTGFAGSSENALAVTRGDVDCMAADYGSDLPTIQSGDHRALLAIADEKLPELPDVPMALDQKFPSSNGQKIMTTHIHLIVDFERPIVAPPGVEAGKLQALRDALAAVAADPSFQKDLIKAGRSTRFENGKDTAALVQDLLHAPKEYVDILKKAYQQ